MVRLDRSIMLPTPCVMRALIYWSSLDVMSLTMSAMTVLY